MTTIDHLEIATPDLTTARRFYADALGLGDLVRPREEDAPGGFQGYTLSLVAAQPSDVDALMSRALDAGARALQEPKKSLWGYGGSLVAPDGTIVTLASENKKDTAPPTRRAEHVVLQLGVDDVSASQKSYEDRGFIVSKSYGKRYVEFETGAVTMSLNKRAVVAKAASVEDRGGRPQGLIIVGGSEAFTDPDGYDWKPAEVSPPTQLRN